MRAVSSLSMRALVLAIAIALPACVAQHRIAAPGARLSVPTESFIDDGPFRLLFAGPKGDLEGAREITLAFSRPVRALGVIGDDTTPPPASVTRVHDGAKVAGVWRWFGERTAVFWPNGGFANATEYRVVVDSRTRAFDGSSLADAPTFTLASARPSITRASYEYDPKAAQHIVHVALNATIGPDALRNALRLEGRGAKGLSSVPFHVIGADAGTEHSLHVDRAVTALEDVVLVSSRDLACTEGPLTSDRETRTALPEIGPLRGEVVCRDASGEDVPKAKSPRCAGEDEYIALRLTKDVAAKDLTRHLVVSASAPAPPRPVQPRSYEPETTSGMNLSEVMSLRPGGKYRITLKAGLRAVDEDRLPADQVIDFSIADLVPHISWRDIGKEAVVEAARPSVVMELGAMNVTAFDAARAPLDEAHLFSFLVGTPTAAQVRALPASVTTRIAVAATKNDQARTRFDLPSSMRPAGGKGTFAVATHADGIEDDVRILSVTDLGVTSKWSPHGGLVWVTRLTSAAPVQNAAVSLRRVWRPAISGEPARSEEAFATKTNAQGLAVIPSQVAATFLDGETAAPDAILIASDEAGDRTHAHLPHLDEGLAHAIGHVFTDRRIYRPGETAFVKGVFRAPTPQGLVGLVGRKATIEATDYDDRVIFAATATFDAFGSFSLEMPIPKTAKLGSAKVRARLGVPGKRADRGRASHRRRSWGSLEWAASAGIVIDEFRTIEFKVDAESDRRFYIRGDTARITARGMYLHGAPMHDVPVTISASRSPAVFRPHGLERFSTDSYAVRREGSNGPLMGTEVPLGANGTVTTAIDLTAAAINGPETVSVWTSIPDISRSFEAGSETSLIVHPSDFYLGIATPDLETIYPGRRLRAELVAASIDGTRRPDLSAHVELLRSTPSGITKHDEVTKELVATDTGKTCDVRTTNDVVVCDFVAPEPGVYWLRATTRDSRGRTVGAATRVYVSSREPPVVKPALPTPPPKPAPQPPPELPFADACRGEVSRDRFTSFATERPYRTPYQVGETARLCLRGRGKELFTMEREGVLRHEMMSFGQAGALFDLPITPALHPNVRLALHAVSPRTSPFPSGPVPRADTGHPSAGSSYIDLGISAPEKNLVVAIENDEEYRPGAEITMRVRVHDGANRPALSQVTLWAVDEGVVQLEPFKLPDLAERFGDERPPDVVLTDTRDLVFWEKIGMHTVKSPSLRQGATQTSARDHVARALIRPTAFFFPSLVTGPDGVATVRAKLPDNLTTWNVYAVATTVTDGFGGALGSFRTNKPLMARPELPRFLRVGDHVDATVVIDSMSAARLDVKVSMRTSGVITAEKPDVPMSFAIPPHGHVPVRFAIDARAAGRGAVTFRVEAPGVELTDEVTIEESVSASTTLEAVAISGETKSRVDEPLGDLSRARADVGSFDFRLASTPLVGLGESLTGLIEYPYGCTEQLTSRLVPLVRLRSLARELGVVLPGDVDASVRSAIGSLLSHQRSDGGFGFWPGSKKSEPWLTILAVNALTAAADAGYAFPIAPVARSTTYLDGVEVMDAAERALLEDVFASHGAPRAKELRKLGAEADQATGMPVFARSLVAHALAKVDRDLGKRILGKVASQARIAGATATIGDEASLDSRRHLSSDVRTTAITLRAFLALDPKNPLVAKLVRGLLAQRSGGRWATTQASAWALLALDEARAEFPESPAMNARLTLDGTELARGSSATGSVPMARLAGSPGAALSFSVEGGPLYYEGVLRYSRREPPKTPLEHGIDVVKTMQVLRRDGSPPRVTTSDEFRVGDYVEVNLTLATPVSRELVVLDDPIPAGFEAVNQSYANADRHAFYSDVSQQVTHRELRDDRVVSFFDRLPAGASNRTRYLLRVVSGGKYVVPPTKAECMYAPDVFGRTASSVVTARQ